MTRKYWERYTSEGYFGEERGEGRSWANQWVLRTEITVEAIKATPRNIGIGVKKGFVSGLKKELKDRAKLFTDPVGVGKAFMESPAQAVVAVFTADPIEYGEYGKKAFDALNRGDDVNAAYWASKALGKGAPDAAMAIATAGLGKAAGLLSGADDVTDASKRFDDFGDSGKRGGGGGGRGGGGGGGGKNPNRLSYDRTSNSWTSPEGLREVYTGVSTR